MSIPEVEARSILSQYEGSNNHILIWKKKLEDSKTFKISRTQAEYILKYHDVVPKVARKFVEIVSSYGSTLMDQKHLTSPPTKIWIEKLLCESEKAYHIWGKIYENEKLTSFWVPKAAIIPEEKKLNRTIDYSQYDKPGRLVMNHQKVAIEKLLVNNRFILADDQGLGKTTSAVIASIESGAKKVLIICPASLKINWQREIEIYSNKKILIVSGTKWGSTFEYYIVNYDILKNFHTTEKSEDCDAYKLITNAKFDLAIVDEAHYASNKTALRTQLLNDILATIPKVWLLTGTPMTSRPINYFNLLQIVNSPVTLNWQHYVKRYCGGFQFKVKGVNGGKNKKVWKTNGATHLDELHESTRSLVLRRLKKDILDLPEKIISPIYLELHNNFYDEELEEFLKISESQKGEETISITLSRLMKVRQLIAMEKIPYTCELIDKTIEQNKKVIVFTNFTASLDAMRLKYPKNSVVLDGRMSLTQKQKSVDEFQNNDKIEIIFANLKAGGVGWNLTAAECVIVNDLCFVPADHAQAEDRAYRIGQKNSVIVYYPIFDNTIERIIYNILQLKKNIFDQVMGDGEYSEGFAKELLGEIL